MRLQNAHESLGCFGLGGRVGKFRERRARGKGKQVWSDEGEKVAPHTEAVAEEDFDHQDVDAELDVHTIVSSHIVSDSGRFNKSIQEMFTKASTITMSSACHLAFLTLRAQNRRVTKMVETTGRQWSLR